MESALGFHLVPAHPKPGESVPHMIKGKLRIGRIAVNPS